MTALIRPDEGERTGEARLVLLGDDPARAGAYTRAAAAFGRTVVVTSITEYPALARPGDLVKIDPLAFGATRLDALASFARGYRQALTTLESLPGVRFLNQPSGLIAALDKRETRARLERAGVSMPEALSPVPATYDDLAAALDAARWTGAFLKPRFGSGAAGVLAYARGSGGRERLHGALAFKNGVFENISRVRSITDPGEIRAAINFVLGLEAVAERWIPKDRIGRRTYDLRVVCSTSRVCFAVGRVAAGPITNLHLNGRAASADRLPLRPEDWEGVERLCLSAMAAFDDLRFAGIDVLISAQQRAPMVLEINGQGDMLHADAFAENRVMKAEIETLLGVRS